MRHLLHTTVFGLALMLGASPAWSAIRTVTLSVPAMNCPVCPVTVKAALGKVAGVTRTEVDFERRLAHVTFDDAKTDVQSLTHATRDAGYPSTPVKP